ncbi:MAG: AlpA family phage regulatory protein [Afipia sp.]|nr:AlpA family phage regulatory protein [Afipia sp.]
MLKTDQYTLPDQLIDVQTAARHGGMKRSHLHALVRKGKFPAPVIRAPRFTRWRMSDVQAWVADPAGWMENNAAKQEPTHA